MPDSPHALIVSHACVVPVNQSVFAFLSEQGWKLDLVVPAAWSHEYAEHPIPAARLPEFDGGFHPRRVGLAGQPQRHFYVGGCASLLRHMKPQVAFLEEESFSVPAFQWGLACRRLGIPFGVQAAENLDRPLPSPARLFRRWTLRNAGFVAARSPTAKRLAESWGARGAVEVIPHAVPAWTEVEVERESELFTVGFAGRLVEEKGLFDLVRAAERVPGRVRVLLVGNGPLRDDLARMGGPEIDVVIVSDLAHEEMASAFAAMDVLVLPSRTTRTWVEQFGRVLVEALWCGVPVVGSSSGEIPWVVEATGGGVVFPEGDIAALASGLENLRDHPEERARLASTGRMAVERLFSVEAAGRLLDQVMRSVMAGPLPPIRRDDAHGARPRASGEDGEG